MQTSPAIKAYQYEPIMGTRKGGTWTFDSETRERVQYITRREDDTLNYKCGCPATGLCKHITSAVLDDAGKKYETVQVWTDQADAKRQHRATVQATANGHPFWITYAGVQPLSRVVRFCATWGSGLNNLADLYFRNPDGSDYYITVSGYDRLEKLAQSEGWVWSGAYLKPPVLEATE